jgi:molybdopterin synthase catalytic subunit/molybdopterin converting factor small subunit
MHAWQSGVRMEHVVTVEYFAAARELSGVRSERIALTAPRVHTSELLASIAQRHAALAPLLARMRLAINGEITAEGVEINAGDSVALLPPVAGGAWLCELRSTALSVDEVLASLRAPEAGGIALFIGTVRDHAGGRAVARLDYEAHPQLARQEMTRILQALSSEYPGVRLAAVHRVGELAIGELAVIVGASAAHRAEAFAACRAAIERIKEHVPIWKKEWADDGTGTWVNLDG